MATSAGGAKASGVPQWSVQQLAAFADLVVIGKIDHLESAWDSSAKTIYTYIAVDVQRVLKGSVETRRIVIKQLGGRVARLGLHVADQAEFSAGETALLFLEVRPRDGTLYTSGLWQGKFTLDARRRDPIATRAAWGDVHGAVQYQALSSIERDVTQAPATRNPNHSIALVPREHAALHVAGGATDSHGFTLLGPLRYLFSPPVDMQEGGHPGLADGGLNAILAAIHRWNAAGAAFQYTLGTAAGPARCSTDELGNSRVTISFMDPCEEMSNSGGTLAIGGSYYQPHEGGNVDGESFSRALEGFVVTNDGDAALRYLAMPGCFEDVHTHELGHVLGLGHSTDPAAIMFPAISPACELGPRGLSADDNAGLTYIYGFSRRTSPTISMAAPGNLHVQVNGTASVTVSWTASEASSTAAPAATPVYRLDFRRGHDERSLVGASYTTSATSLTIAVPQNVTGDFNVIVTPVTHEGWGAPSHQVNFSVCATPPPSVIRLSAAVVDGVARVSWEPSPGATAYGVIVGSTPGSSDLYGPTTLGDVTEIQANVLPGFVGWVRLFAINACGVSAGVDVAVR